jgi:hypothetical protein
MGAFLHAGPLNPSLAAALGPLSAPLPPILRPCPCVLEWARLCPTPPLPCNQPAVPPATNTARPNPSASHSPSLSPPSATAEPLLCPVCDTSRDPAVRVGGEWGKGGRALAGAAVRARECAGPPSVPVYIEALSVQALHAVRRAYTLFTRSSGPDRSWTSFAYDIGRRRPPELLRHGPAALARRRAARPASPVPSAKTLDARVALLDALPGGAVPRRGVPHAPARPRRRAIGDGERGGARPARRRRSGRRRRRGRRPRRPRGPRWPRRRRRDDDDAHELRADVRHDPGGCVFGGGGWRRGREPRTRARQGPGGGGGRRAAAGVPE